ncbi:DNRLRE domain-containing protein [Alkaliphilus hydrothermalis]|uniref:RHS repeat-associated protein n=1 Tax=Alkaliphilus hydrothermalis TaxID=1482730 RepID=A0ABS2NUK0_9FIRM|nr:DNRLRE domain-containing protein [Alkaliphilus hydrothermalis]MBM7616442.1 RHS repeat-associated protein [Alkaliphilus hydrothermalis]
MSLFNSKLFKSISLILVFMMLFNLAGITYVDASATNERRSFHGQAKEKIQAKIGELPNTPPSERMELTSKRTRYSTRYINPDGSFTEEIFLEPTYYQDPTTKEYKKINNRLNASARKSGKLENKSNDFNAFFSNASGTNELLSVEKNGRTIDFIPVGAKKVNGKTTNNEILYQGIYSNVDFRYELQGSKVKEDIILHQYTGQNVFSFELKLKGYTVAQGEDGIIYFTNNKGEKEWYFEPPFMLDANEKYSDDVKFTLRQEGGKTFVDVVAGVDFLENPDTKYPVIIDPTINNWDIMMDTFISNWYPSSSFSGATRFYTGYDSGYYGTMRSMVKFFLPSLPSDAHITSANFNAYQNGTNTDTVTVDLHRVTSDWTNSVTWNTQPTIKSTAESGVTSNASGQYWQFYITQLVKDWYYGTQPNYGVMLKQSNETSNFRRFTSIESGSYTPRLTIDYTVEPIGQEDFWGYSKDGVNIASGNLVLQQGDLSIPGRGIPVGLTRTFNSRKNHVTGIFGNGWRSNYEAIIVDTGSGPITLVDGDSTRHIFGQKIGGGYAPAGGIYLDLVKNADGTYTITQMDGTKINFNTSGKITTMVDTNNNTTTLNYSSGRLVSVTDASDRITSLAYNANGFVSSVTDPANRVIQYQYDTEGNLTKVIDPEAKAITMAYGTDKSLTTVTDQRGVATTIGYDTSNRVASISSPITIDGVATTSTTTYNYVSSTTTTMVDGEGRRIDYEYNSNKNMVQMTENPLDSATMAVTTFVYDDNNNLVQITDANNNKKTEGKKSYVYQYDANGNVISVQLPEGQKSEFFFDDKNNQISESDPEGNISRSQYDDSNNQTASVDAAIQSTASRYFANGNQQYSFKNITSADNLNQNSSFELDADLNNQPDHWTNAVESGKTATFDWSSVSKYGNKSISISNPTGWAVVSSDLIPYETGKNYVFSGNVKTDNTVGHATIKVDFFNDQGNWLGQKIANSITGTHDWTRLQAVVDEVPVGTTQMKLVVSLAAGTGTAYFDGVQIEKGSIASNYNLLENSGFERDSNNDGIPNQWTTSGNFTTNDKIYTKADVTDENVLEGQHSFKITGESGKNKFIRQRINLSGGPNTKLTLSGWSRQVGANPNGGNYLMQVAINHTDGTVDWNNANDFSKTETEWQHVAASVNVNATKNFSSIDVYYYYYNQTGTAYFDGTRLEVGDSVTSYNYDTRGNYTTSVKDGLGNTVSFGYDDGGNKTSITDGKLKTTYFAYDKRNLLTRVTDTKGGITSYSYDNAGNRTTITDARSKVTNYEFNEFNQISKIINPLNQVTRLEYDKNGNQTKLIYPKGDTISSSYNALNRLDKILYNGVQRFGYTYDANGNVTGITDTVPSKNQTITYDDNARLTKVETGTNNSIQYNYDLNSNITSLVKTAGATSITTGYSYNQLNQMVQLTRNGSNLARFVYDEEGNIITTNRQNDSSTTSLFDEANRLKNITNFSRTGGILNRFTYSYDANGNRTNVVTNSGTINYQYDDLNQLTQETLLDGTTISYEHDAVGNRTKKISTTGGVATTTNYTYNDGNELISVNGQAYSYDANGNLTNNGNKTYIYDLDNRLKEVKDNQGQTIASFTYDHEGKRNSMTTNSGTTHFHYNGDEVVYETDSNNAIVAEYTYDPESNPATMTRGGVTYYYHINGHGDVVTLTDASANVVAEYDYDAYGNIISQSGTMASVNPYRYAGYRYDEVTGLYYLMARYYDAVVGRFISRDPFHGIEADPSSLNQYNYCGSNPVMYTDPTGNYWGNHWWNSRFVVKTALNVALALIVGGGLNAFANYAKKLTAKYSARSAAVIFSDQLKAKLIAKGMKASLAQALGSVGKAGWGLLTAALDPGSSIFDWADKADYVPNNGYLNIDVRYGNSTAIFKRRLF